MDQSFESSEPIITNKKKNNVPKYKASDLKGLKVGHDLSEFQEGQETILTLKDRGILDEGDDGSDDELTNVNIEDAERLKKNLETKKQKPGYNPYDDDEFSVAPGEKPSFLPQYDDVDEAGNQKQQKSKGFVLGNYGSVTAASVAATRAKHQASQPQLSVADKLKQVESLDYDKTLHVADYYTQEEMPFKKPKKLKKKKKLRQRTTTTLNKNNNHDDDTNGNRDGNNDGEGKEEEEEEEEDIKLPYQVPEDANFVDDDDLQAALSKSRKEANRLKKKAFKKMTPEDIAKSFAEERENNNSNDQQDDENNTGGGGGLILSETTEFLNSVGNVPIYVREQRERRAITPVEDDDKDEEEKDNKNQGDMSKRTSMVDTDEEVEHDDEEKLRNAVASDNTPSVPMQEEPVIEEEPLVGRGIAATLSLLSQKGFITKANDEQLARDRRIADQIKWQAESKKREKQMERQRDRRSGGGGGDRHRDYDSDRQKEREERDRLREFEQRMANYKPDVKLEYIDDQGNSLKTKEAFRFMSHKFHGKTSGKGKTEKRLQKREEEKKLNMMSSTDTPLNLAGALLERQQKTGNAHVVLSVGNRGVVPTDAAKELGVKRSLDQNNTPNKKR
ncbi:unnamed protein product [Cunninghamella echinulata]